MKYKAVGFLVGGERCKKNPAFFRLAWRAWKKCLPKIFLPNSGEFNGEFHPMGSNP